MFMTTPILTWFSNKNEENCENLLQLIAKQHANQFICHLFNMTSFIFNNLLQSLLKGIARDTQNFLGDQGQSPLQFGLQILERIMRSSAGLALEDGPHWKAQRIQVQAPWGPVFLADERRDVGLNPPLGNSWAMWGRRVLQKGPRCFFQNIRNVPATIVIAWN